MFLPDWLCSPRSRTQRKRPPAPRSYMPRVETVESRIVPAFVAPLSIHVGLLPYALGLGDFNGDNVPDLAVANAHDNNVTVLLGNGDGTFRTGAAVPVGSSPQAVGVGDFNGDGKLDLAVANTNDDTVSVL